MSLPDSLQQYNTHMPDTVKVPPQCSSSIVAVHRCTRCMGKSSSIVIAMRIEQSVQYFSLLVCAHLYSVR